MKEFDLYLSIGIDCAVADNLNRTNLRKEACPLDWMRDYPLSTIINYVNTDFDEMFSTNIEEVNRYNDGENTWCNNRWVIDRTNNIVCLHHFNKCQDLEENRISINKLMKKRWDRLNNQLKSIKSLCIVCNRQEETDEELISFLKFISNRYPNLYIRLINIRNEMFWERGRIEEKETIINNKLSLLNIHFNNWQIIETGEAFDWYGNREMLQKIFSEYKCTNNIIGEKDIFEQGE